MNVDDAIYNWLSIKVVAEARKNDLAAKDTYDFFYEILQDDYQVEEITVVKEEDWYVVDYTIDGERGQKRYPSELIEALLMQIESEPKYN